MTVNDPMTLPDVLAIIGVALVLVALLLIDWRLALGAVGVLVLTTGIGMYLRGRGV